MASNSVQLRFDYAELEPETRAYVLQRTEHIHNLARMTASGIVRIGQYLTEVKERLPHGRFLEWIEREFAWSRFTADRFMNVHERVKCSNLQHLDIDVSALYQIAAPSTPEPVRKGIIQRAENGEKVTFQGLRAVVQEFADTGKMPELEVSLPQLIASKRKALAEESRKPSSAEQKEIDEMRRQRKANGERNARLFAVIGGIEAIADTHFTVEELAKDIQRLDTPDKDWVGKTRVAANTLRLLAREYDA